MDANQLQHGLTAAIELASHANGFVEARAPWAAARDPERAAELDATLAALARCVATLSVMLQPFMPTKMAVLQDAVGLAQAPEPIAFADLATLDLAGRRVSRGEVLFPRAELAKSN
jgi:methionyl-tRNA synthetase